MFLQENFQYFDFFDAIEMGLYFIIIGYYFLIFAYFILMKFRTTKRLYWLFFSLVFIFLAAGRLFFIGLMKAGMGYVTDLKLSQSKTPINSADVIPAFSERRINDQNNGD